jgi:hypothetical protein
MPLTLDLTPEILERLTQAAIASGISVEDYTLQVLAANLPVIAQPHLPLDRQATIQQMNDFRAEIVTYDPALSQTVVESRTGERY